MSVLAERSATGALCPRCGARARADQEWCLECGAPLKVRIRAAPDWRVPVAIVGGVIALCAVGLVFALVALSNTANRSVSNSPPPPSAPQTSQPAAAGTKTPPAATSTTATTAPTSTIASWPAGVTGFTVILGVDPTEAVARANAARLAASGIPVGVLYSSDYSTMRPGDWIVFSGTYTTRAEATTAATQLKSKGQVGAYPFSVVPAATTTTTPTTTGATASTPSTTAPTTTTP